MMRFIKAQLVRRQLQKQEASKSMYGKPQLNLESHFAN